jgi:hypothetical protein
MEGKAYQYGWLNLILFTYQRNPFVRENMWQHNGDITANKIRQKAMMHLGTITKDDQDSNMLYNFPLQVGR